MQGRPTRLEIYLTIGISLLLFLVTEGWGERILAALSVLLILLISGQLRALAGALGLVKLDIERIGVELSALEQRTEQKLIQVDGRFSEMERRIQELAMPLAPVTVVPPTPRLWPRVMMVAVPVLALQGVLLGFGLIYLNGIKTEISGVRAAKVESKKIAPEGVKSGAIGHPSGGLIDPITVQSPYSALEVERQI
jgi:hypothetical protein